MEDNTLQSLFGPLGRSYCAWFYWLAVLGFIFLILTVVSGIALMFNERRFRPEVLHSVIMTAVMYGIFYFQNRLLYSMCIN
jgi:hypothetical protein